MCYGVPKIEHAGDPHVWEFQAGLLEAYACIAMISASEG